MAEESKIRDLQYKGFACEVWISGDKDWGEHKNMFFAKSEYPFDVDFFPTFTEMENHFKSEVDKFLSESPKTIDELVDGIENCLVWTGYEDCHLDKKTASILIESYINNIKRSK